MDRRTIHRWITAGDVDRDPTALIYGPRPAVPTMLDPYRPLIDARLHTYPALTVVRLFDEVRAAGYPGSLPSSRPTCGRCVRSRRRSG